MKKLLLPVLLLGLSGCATLGIVPPEVALVDIEFDDLTVFETSGTFTIRLSNENPEPLQIGGGVFRLYLNGVKIGKALSSEPMEIPRLGTATQEVALHVNNVALVSQLLTARDQSSLAYRIKSKLFLERSYGTRKMSFDNSGSIELDKLRRNRLSTNLEDELDGP